MSVVVPTYNVLSTRGKEPLRRCLAALCEQSRPADEICIADSSTDETPRVAAELCPEAKIVHSDERLLSGAARNLGARSTTGEIIAFIDSDCVASPNWLAELERELTHHSEAPGATAPLCGPPDETVVAALDRIVHISHLVHLRRAEVTERASTSNLAVRREAFDAVGGFRGSLLGNPDLLISQALVRRFGPLRVARNAWVQHLSRDTLEAVLFHHRRFGRGFVDGRRADPSLDGAWAVRHTLFIPLLPVARSLLLLRRLAKYDRQDLWVVLRHPLLFARLMSAWTRGVWEAARGETSREWDFRSSDKSSDLSHGCPDG